MKLEKKPQTTTIVSKVNQPYKENLKKLMLKQVLQEIKNNRGKVLGEEMESF